MVINMAEQAYSQQQRVYYRFVNDLFAEVARSIRPGRCRIKRTFVIYGGHPDDEPARRELYAIQERISLFRKRSLVSVVDKRIPHERSPALEIPSLQVIVHDRSLNDVVKLVVDGYQHHFDNSISVI